jgi:hypothetical protein
MEIAYLPNMVNPKSGLTYREENLKRNHKFKINDLVEIIGWSPDCEYDGMRLYIIGLTRDCDDTPLYVLGSKGMELYQTGFGLKENACYNFQSYSGFNEDNLKLIK